MTEASENIDFADRVAALIREKNELSQQLKQLTALYDGVLAEKERLEEIIASVPHQYVPDSVRVETQHALKFKMVTVMYLDIRAVTSITSCENSADAIDELDQVMFHFNDIAEKYRLQVCKTIGYSFLCAGGIPEKNITNPIDVVLAALEMNDYLQNVSYRAAGEKFWQLRIGIHTGPVTATASGRKKITYEIKGDTVNNASRIAAAAEVNKINVSVFTYELVKEFFVTEFCGVIPVKYRDLEMYQIKRLKKDYSLNVDRGFYPNSYFQIKYALRQFTDLQEQILDKLERELPPFLYYHNTRHTIDVVNQVEIIGYGEEVSDEDLLLLKTAALFHDTGYVVGSDNHEYFGTQIAREILPKWNYTQEQIEKICQLIMATKLPPNPKDKFERIMCDADLVYLGRTDFIPVSNMLYDELKALGSNLDIDTWNQKQVDFLSKHQYFTQTAHKVLEVGKEYQIERLKNLIAKHES
ncbi:MAG: HD domain-containing protein [Bacteroidales bacterium]|nr:HD domain-containing protein [Bacteroidales bacterium]MBO7142799.1 HD domain-containing protein [Bacteroidales bacterium]